MDCGYSIYKAGSSDEPACVELTNKIKGSMYKVANEFVYIGFLLAECDYYETYKDWGYSSIHEYASDQLGFKKSSTYNFINVCKAFSANFNTVSVGYSLPFSMIMKDSYSSFNYSQLVEMLSMNEKQRSQVTPDMSVKQIREVKKSSDEPDYITLFNQQFKFEEFNYQFIKKIDGKKFRLLIKGKKVDVSDLWPDGYILSIDTDFGDSGSGSGYQPFVDYEKFKDLITSKIPGSRRLEDIPEVSSDDAASLQKVHIGCNKVNKHMLYDLFDEMEDMYLSFDEHDKSLFECALELFEKYDYHLYRDSFVYK